MNNTAGKQNGSSPFYFDCFLRANQFFNRFFLKLVLFAIPAFFISVNSNAASVLEITDQQQSELIFKSAADYINVNHINDPNEILAKNLFNPIVKSGIPVYSDKVNDVWIKFKVKNAANFSTLYFDLRYTNLSEVVLYKIVDNRVVSMNKGGNTVPAKSGVIKNLPNITFDLDLKRGEEGEYLLHIKSEHPIILPAFIVTPVELYSSASKQIFVSGLYLGLLVVMFIYNLFLYASTRDKNYFAYSIYVFALLLAHLAVTGYGFLFLWPNFPAFNYYTVVFSSCFSGIAATYFAMLFLHTSFHTPKAHIVLKIFIAIFLFGILSNCFHKNVIAYFILNYNSLVLSVFVTGVAIKIAIKGERSASFYLIAWTAFIVSLIITVFRNVNVLPYNDFTAYIFYLGSGIEAALLSIALADKINTYKLEKEISQAEALKVSRQNEKLILEQNIVLEQRVTERTEALQDANHQLNGALTNLKDAQTQLVDAEKMASLGQLTAGIAHEINNPINFVKSNIKPLQLDFRDLEELLTEYNKLHGSDEKSIKAQLVNIANLQKQIDLPFVKTEIVSLIKGIEEGAERTAEIVRGLRTFSRLDEGELKTVSIHEGIDSTLVLLKNSLPYNVSIVKDFKADGNIDCYPGKLNQVFMNIINNGIQAIQAKPAMSEKETVTITTKDTGNGRIIISIKDSGIGMSDEVKQKIFEPFFTTKPVGEGTGLGMAIAFKIIETHKGKIDIISSPGNGSEFILSLPHTLSETSQNPK